MHWSSRCWGHSRMFMGWYVRMTEAKEVDTRICKSARALSLSGHKTFKHRKMSFFKWSSPMIMNFELCPKSAVWIQAEGIGFFRRACGVTLGNKVRSCEIRKALNVGQLLLQIESRKIPAILIRSRDRKSQEKSVRQVLLATPTGKR